MISNKDCFFNTDSTYGSDHDNIIIDHTGRSLSISIKGDAVGNRVGHIVDVLAVEY